MKTIEIEDDLYHFIASQTHHIGESASSILRRLLAYDNMEQATKNAVFYNTNSNGLANLVNSDAFLFENKVVNRFLMILAELYACNNNLFSLAAVSLQGSKRRYIDKDETTLIKTGSNTKPRVIPDTPYKVITNTNTQRKIFIIEYIMNYMRLPPDLIELVITRFNGKEFEEDDFFDDDRDLIYGA
ncbi:hypothetical protein RCS94_08730 [Orbaceae bacterium ac157xtp]